VKLSVESKPSTESFTLHYSTEVMMLRAIFIDPSDNELLGD
jgi:hypothetical protein